MGGRQEVAGASPSADLAAASGTSARRAVLRRFGGGARTGAGASAVERRQPAPHQLLSLGAAGVADRLRHGKRGAIVLSASSALQSAPGRRRRRERRGRGAVLL